jgi:hypothetical protein
MGMTDGKFQTSVALQTLIDIDETLGKQLAFQTFVEGVIKEFDGVDEKLQEPDFKIVCDEIRAVCSSHLEKNVKEIGKRLYAIYLFAKSQ